MKFECEKEKVLQGMLVTEKIAGTNPTLPVLSCVLCIVKDDTLTIRSTNLELGIEYKIKVTSEKDGICAVPASTLLNTLQNTQESHITFEVKEKTLLLHTKKSTTKLNIIEHDDFPSLPQIEKETVYAIQSKDFVDGVQSVVYSASHSTIKPELSSIYIYGLDKKLFFVATDSFRLAEKVIHIKQKSTLEQSILIPLRNASEIVRILQFFQDEEVEIIISKNQIAFVCKNVFITSRIIDGTFPDYKQIIPKDYISEVVVIKQDILQVFKKINIFSDKFGQVTVAVHPKKKEFIIHTKNSLVGETTDSIDAVIQGEEIDMRFNYRYILDCLNSIHSDSVTFLFTGIGKPLIVKGVSDESFLYLVMPMNK